MSLAALCLCMAATPVPEPGGFWLGPERGPVPATLSGGTVIHASELVALLLRGDVSLVDVSSADRRPAGLPAGAIWLPLRHEDIAVAAGNAVPVATGNVGKDDPPRGLELGSVSDRAWLPDAGQPVLSAAGDVWLRSRLDALTHGSLTRTVVFYCHPECWRSWNAAKRAIGYGYHDVRWYPDGIEGWRDAANPVAVASPELMP